MYSRATVILKTLSIIVLKRFWIKKHRIQEKVVTAPKKPLFLALLYLEPLSLQTRFKLRKSFKGILNCWDTSINLEHDTIAVFSTGVNYILCLWVKKKYANSFRIEDRMPKELKFGVAFKLQCGLCNESYYDECVRHLNVRIVEQIETSPLTKKEVKPKGYFVIIHHLLKVLVC